MNSAYIELPYDRGHNWHLVVGSERTVVSERAALVLACRFGVPIQNESSLAKKQTAFADSVGENYHLSGKAQRMLRAAGIQWARGSK